MKHNLDSGDEHLIQSYLLVQKRDVLNCIVELNQS